MIAVLEQKIHTHGKERKIIIFISWFVASGCCFSFIILFYSFQVSCNEHLLLFMITIIFKTEINWVWWIKVLCHYQNNLSACAVLGFAQRK